jgi:transposase-like protein
MVSVLIKRLVGGEIDHAAPNHCPECGSKRVATHVQIHEGEIYESGYCPECEYPYFPEVLGNWSPWKPNWDRDKYLVLRGESVKDRRVRMQGRNPWI